ncbi:hypothetical protein UO65_2461 [Actinokineospora spheciospongiae]|uniref:Uncharacterized protein n=1 Tax=Actinokineospora spheciospongiae TaxID=909613 RepID=W7IZU6_9PSEU|nr:hypothetical protein UO65_2461 [Actinokineospora spheciospongiae]
MFFATALHVRCFKARSPDIDRSGQVVGPVEIGSRRHVVR